MIALYLSYPIYNLVSKYITAKAGTQDCNLELNYMIIIFIILSIIACVIYYTFMLKKGLLLTTHHFIIFLCVIFILLQIPFFINEVGTFYNCQTDGQTILGFMFSSPKVSVLIPFFGLINDFIYFKLIKTI